MSLCKKIQYLVKITNYFIQKPNAFKPLLVDIILCVEFLQLLIIANWMSLLTIKGAASWSCKRSETLFKSLLFWLAGEVSWLAVQQGVSRIGFFSRSTSDVYREVHWAPEVPNVKEFFKNINSLLAGLSFKLTNQVASFTQLANNSTL